MQRSQLFDEWPERYEQWFQTPIGSLVRVSEQELIMQFLSPQPHETILDAGCGTAVFTTEMLLSGSRVTGLDLSFSMVRIAADKGKDLPFSALVGDMACLPFRDRTFDKAVSITALEFIRDAKGAVEELFRVTRSGGLVVVATLNSESPWAERRRAEARTRESIFSKAIFRSPREMLDLSPLPGVVRTAVHFSKGSGYEEALQAERQGRENNLLTGAFVAVCWRKGVGENRETANR